MEKLIGEVVKLFWQVDKFIEQVETIFWQMGQLFWQVGKMIWQVGNYFGRWTNFMSRWENDLGRWEIILEGGKIIQAGGKIDLAGGKIILAGEKIVKGNLITILYLMASQFTGASRSLYMYHHHQQQHHVAHCDIRPLPLYHFVRLTNIDQPAASSSLSSLSLLFLCNLPLGIMTDVLITDIGRLSRNHYISSLNSAILGLTK